jgi:hypothetical protein
MPSGLNLTPAVVALSVALLAVVPARSEAAAVAATIPFSFAVGDRTLPPGAYRVVAETASGIIVLQGVTGHALAMTSLQHTFEDVQPKLVFHKYGDDFFLRLVWRA